MLTKPISRMNQPRRPRTQACLPSSELSRLLSAAVINKKFRDLLLSDPARALSQGFCGEGFTLDREQKDLVLAIQTDSLSDFALQVTSTKQKEAVSCSSAWIPVNQPAFVMDPR